MARKVTVACAVCGKPVCSYPSQRPVTCGRGCQDKRWADRCRAGQGNLKGYMQARAARAAARAEKILGMADQRIPVLRIAASMGVSDETVYGVLRKYRKRDHQRKEGQ